MVFDSIIFDYLLGIASSKTAELIPISKAKKQHDLNEFRDNVIVETSSVDEDNHSSVLPKWRSLSFLKGHGQPNKVRALLSGISEANIYLFIESKASTFYNLVFCVIEDNRTNDWYPFSLPLAFQGGGGGWGNTKEYFYEIKEAKDAGHDHRVSLRVVSNENLDKFNEGELTWNEMKSLSVSALIAEGDIYQEIKDRYEKEFC